MHTLRDTHHTQTVSLHLKNTAFQLKYEMKTKTFTLIIGFLIMTQGVLFATEILIDSLDNKKIDYNEQNKPVLISWNYNSYEIGKTLYYHKILEYNDQNLLIKVLQYALDSKGDTLIGLTTLMTFEYTDGKLSLIDNKGSVLYSEIIWDNDKLMEYKYYYRTEGIIDSSKTRIIKNTYENDNAKTSIYKEIDGRTFHNEEFQYDDKINPLYHSDISLSSGDLIFYCCKNNWLKSTNLDSNDSNWSRTISYNSNNYPLTITTDYNNGNIGTQKFKYNINLGFNNYLTSDKIKIYPNPTQGLINIGDYGDIKFNSIYLLDHSGQTIKKFENFNDIDISELPDGLYLLKLNYDRKTMTKKIIKTQANTH